MAGRFADSFGHYVTADIVKKWTNVFGPGVQITASAPAGRVGAYGMFFQTGLGTGGSASKTLDYQSGWTVGWAIYLVSSTNGISGDIYTIYNNGASLGKLSIQPDSTVSVTVGSVTTDFPGLVINPNQWYYFEFQSTTSIFSVTNIGLAFTVRVNGVTILSGGPTDTGIVISNTLHNDATANRHAWSGGLGNNGSYIKDLYVVDNTNADGLGVTSFQGDVTVGFLFPNADNGVTWSIFPASPTTHFSKVNENPADYDTTYIFSPTAGNSDDFLWQHIATFTGTIPFVHYGLYTRKDDQGTRTVKHTVGGTTPTAAFSPGDNYLYYFVAYDGPPGGGVWTVANFNAEDFGVTVVS